MEREPEPRTGQAVLDPLWPTGTIVHRFTPFPINEEYSFASILARRRSRTGRGLSLEAAGGILSAALRLNERRQDGRFGNWESRVSPSAGGTHGLRFLLLPLDRDLPGGLHDPDVNALIGVARHDAARDAARLLLGSMGIPPFGWFAQLIADLPAYSSRYANSASLVLRDAGALCAITALVAEAMDASSCILGHLDGGIVECLALGERYAGTGGVFLTGPDGN